MFRIDKSIKKESRLDWHGWGWGDERSKGRTVNGYRVSMLGNENVLKLIVVIFAQLHDYTENH